MASLDSSIRSAARATSSAYRRLPIRWRLAGGSAALTLVILCGFAAIVGVLTTRRIQSDFSRQKLLDEVWGYDPFSITNTIEVFVSNLRRKLEAGGEPRLLHTVRGAGYVLRV